MLWLRRLRPKLINASISADLISISYLSSVSCQKCFDAGVCLQIINFIIIKSKYMLLFCCVHHFQLVVFWQCWSRCACIPVTVLPRVTMGSSVNMRSLTVLMPVCRYSCDCTATGYYGEQCEYEINECDSSPCQHNATCIDQLMVRWLTFIHVAAPVWVRACVE